MLNFRPGRHSQRLIAVAGALLVLGQTGAVTTFAQNRREFTVSAHKYGFKVEGANGPEIHVRQDDLVSITFSAEDIPHSFTIDRDPYRIMRRAEPGRPVKFDFRADQPGTFDIRCTLTLDDRCKEMLGRLVVDPKR